MVNTVEVQRSLEQLSDRSMPGRERHAIGDWICRAANGVTGRANSCTAIGNPSLSIEQGVDEAEAWFNNRGLRPLFQVWEGCPSELVEAFDRRGYATGEGAEVMVLDVRTAGWPEPEARVTVPELSHTLPVDEPLTPRLEELMMTELPKLVASIPGDLAGTHLSSGVGLLDDDALGIFAMRTAPDHQRQGFAGSILSALLTAGVASGAKVSWLQVMPSNEPALSLYKRFGFESAQAYHYRAAPIS